MTAPSPSLDVWLMQHVVERIRAGSDAIKVLTHQFNHLSRLSSSALPAGQIRLELDVCLEPQHVMFIATDGAMAFTEVWLQ